MHKIFLIAYNKSNKALFKMYSQNIHFCVKSKYGEFAGEFTMMKVNKEHSDVSVFIE